MFIINKKRANFILLSITFSIFISSFNQDFISVNTLPVTNHSIILDAGHGFPDGGATGNDGSVESNLNLEISLKLQNLLEASNCTVFLTRSDKNGIYEENANSIRDKKISDMKNRVNLSKELNSDIFVSIHMNKLDISKYYGFQTFYKNNDEKSKKLADKIQQNLNTYVDNTNTRKIKPISDIYLAKHIITPFVLVECGFLSNINENKLLQDPTYQNKLAWSIYAGIMDYFKEL